MHIIPAYEVVEKEDVRIQILTDIREQGFKASRCAYYHPRHWKVEDATSSHHQMGAVEVLILGDEAFTPITELAQAWLVGFNC